MGYTSDGSTAAALAPKLPVIFVPRERLDATREGTRAEQVYVG
jgi:hypothetical protein